MSVWLTIPSARPTEEANKVLSLWRQHGYKIALWRDDGRNPPICDALETGKYPGYSAAVNALIQEIMDVDETAEWFVIGGDDVEPDLHLTAEEIAAQCSAYFGALHTNDEDERSTFGVMQPTGDRFAGGSIDTICGSAWMGREFCRRINQGKGPLWPEYTHMFVDKELQHVAIKYQCFWQRRDLVHLHRHFLRDNESLDSGTKRNPTPPHLAEANTAAHWQKYQKLFLDRQAAGFPGSEPI